VIKKFKQECKANKIKEELSDVLTAVILGDHSKCK
jgi:NTP pyrophosphatase (non-canonical NTP hydrolase)